MLGSQGQGSQGLQQNLLESTADEGSQGLQQNGAVMGSKLQEPMTFKEHDFLGLQVVRRVCTSRP